MQVSPELLNALIQAVIASSATLGVTIPLIYKFKGDLCGQIAELRISVETHIKLAENDSRQLSILKEKLTNVILKNRLKS